MDFEEIMSYAQIAFYTADFEKAIDHAKKAKEIQPHNPEVHELLAKSYQALGQTDKAVKSFEKAVECDVTNGDRYVELGIAYGGNEQPLMALETFAKAENLHCSDDYKGGMYRTLAMLDYDLGRYGDAVVNFSKAQEWLEPDVELLMYKALSYSMNGDIPKAMQTVNEIQHLVPSNYDGYSLAFTFLMYYEMFDEAREELKKAEKWVAELPMEYYFNKADLEQAEYDKDNDNNHLVNIIEALEEGLEKSKPTINDVVNAYIQVADVYIRLEMYGNAVEFLKASENPVFSFNNNFPVFPQYEPEQESPMPDEYFENSEYQDYDITSLNMEAEERAVAPTGEENMESSEAYRLDKNEPYDFNDDMRERIAMLYIAAYNGMKDYKGVLEYTNKLIRSKKPQVSSTGRYLEAKAHLDMKSPDTVEIYENLISYYKKASIKDPSDITLLTYRVQCYIDLGRYDEAREFCRNLSKTAREPLLKQIHDAEQSSQNPEVNG